MHANRTTVYLKLEDRIQSKNSRILLSDAASITCADSRRKKEIGSIELLRFHRGMDKRQNIGILWCIQKIQQRFPDMEVIPVGPTDVIVEYLSPDPQAYPLPRKLFRAARICFVCLISFFGGAFSIMAFHNDINISGLFGTLYPLLTGENGNGHSILEISYSIGLALGIILFFNHVGKRRITKDPTPIEVAMRMYEQDVNTTLSETANRERKSIDVT